MATLWSNPTYNTMYQFDNVTDVELSYDRVLEITIWEPHCNTNEFEGGIRLGPKPQADNKNKWMDKHFGSIWKLSSTYNSTYALSWILKNI